MIRATLSSVLVLALAALAPVGAARAADLDPAYVEDAGSTPVEFGSGWYLRGDIGTFHAKGTGGYDVGGTATVEGRDWFSDLSGTVGFGNILNEQIRLDATLTHFRGLGFEGESALYPCIGNYNGECATIDSMAGHATAVQANAYFSPMGQGRAFSPYVGAGLGVARVTWDRSWNDWCRLDMNESCALGFNGNPGTAELIDTVSRSETHTSTALAVSLMAGLDYRLSDRTVIDLGYRYTQLRDIGQNDHGTRPRLDTLHLHELKAGLRYELW